MCTSLINVTHWRIYRGILTPELLTPVQVCPTLGVEFLGSKHTPVEGVDKISARE